MGGHNCLTWMMIAAALLGSLAHLAIGADGDAKPADAAAVTGFYDPVEKQIEGWTVEVEPLLLDAAHKDEADRAFTALANHLQRIKYILPAERVAELQRVRIRLELNDKRMGHMQYHPDVDWLEENHFDPRLVKHVHIPVAAALTDRHTWAKHPYVVLHELAHAYHDQVLGFDNPDVLAAYRAMKEKGNYESVLAHTGRKVRHYALTDEKEYFAESTEAYLGVNDFYPFVRAELKECDPKMFEVMRKVWGDVN
ncbi:MAG: metallopeptidase [Phycisphaera sp.]|nr:metallopeptidase [Phycisphaera sp.]